MRESSLIGFLLGFSIFGPFITTWLLWPIDPISWVADFSLLLLVCLLALGGLLARRRRLQDRKLAPGVALWFFIGSLGGLLLLYAGLILGPGASLLGFIFVFAIFFFAFFGRVLSSRVKAGSNS